MTRQTCDEANGSPTSCYEVVQHVAGHQGVVASVSAFTTEPRVYSCLVVKKRCCSCWWFCNFWLVKELYYTLGFCHSGKQSLRRKCIHWLVLVVTDRLLSPVSAFRKVARVKWLSSQHLDKWLKAEIFTHIHHMGELHVCLIFLCKYCSHLSHKSWSHLASGFLNDLQLASWTNG